MKQNSLREFDTEIESGGFGEGENLDFSVPEIQPEHQCICAADVPYEPPRWTIQPYLQRGKLSMIQGNNGIGKTAFMCALAAHVTTGKPLLGLEVQAPGNVLMVSIEDELPTLRGRFEASGGDVSKLFFPPSMVGLTFNCDAIEAHVKEVAAKLVIFDPFQAFLGDKVNMNQANETRPILVKLAEMCKRNDCACLILAHMGKSKEGKAAVNLSLGSVDIPAAMRSIIQVEKSPNNPEERVAVHIKCSQDRQGQTIEYRIGERGGVELLRLSDLDVDDLDDAKRKKDNVPYENDPLVQVFNQLITDKPGGGFWSYTELEKRSQEILGYQAYYGVSELKARLDNGLAAELMKRDGLIATHSRVGNGNKRGITLNRYIQPDGYQTSLEES